MRNNMLLSITLVSRDVTTNLLLIYMYGHFHDLGHLLYTGTYVCNTEVLN